MSNTTQADSRFGTRAVRAGLFATLLAYAAGTTVALAQTQPQILGSTSSQFSGSSMPELMINADGTVIVEDLSVASADESDNADAAPADAGLDAMSEDVASAIEPSADNAEVAKPKAAAPAAKSKVEGTVNVDDAQIVDLHVKDEDLANVLEMLSIQSQKNIIASKGVTARVTANLYGVT